MKKVMIHTFHESEQSTAASALSSVSVVTESYQIGTLDPAQIGELEAQGLIVEVLDENLSETPTRGAQPRPQLESADSTRTTRQKVQNPEIARIGGREDFYIIIRDPLIHEWQMELDQLNVILQEKVETDSYFAHIPLTNVAAVRALSYVHEVIDVDTSSSESARLESASSSEPSSVVKTMDMVLKSSDQMDSARNLLTSMGIPIVGEGRRKIRFQTTDVNQVESLLRQAPDLDGQLAQYHEPQLHNDVAGELMFVKTSAFQASLTGATQLVGIADSGIDESHPDFAGRLVTAFARGRPNDSSDPHGHGTHVAGSMLGDGAASSGLFSGIAPDARFVFQSLLDSNGKLGGLPVDLFDLFQEAFDQGVRIHNNSWGADVDAEYVLDANEADSFVHENPDMLIVTSAGNSAAATGINEPSGTVDLLSMGSLGAGKNLLTVGASRSNRTSGGRSVSTYGQQWPARFPDSPIGDETISGDTDKLAAFSSRGPMQSTRIKPDIVAPGTDIVSARSSVAPDRNYWGNHTNPSYGYMGGTSMASPLVAGVATLVRQYYEDRRSHTPSAALLKATIVNGTKRLKGDHGTSWLDAFPNPHQGFGLLNYATTIPDIHPFGLEFVDHRNSQGQGFTRSGQRARFAIDVNDSRELRVCMAYTDHPGRGSQNGISLFVELPDRTKILGNTDRVKSFNAPDSFNNIQIVRIPVPVRGVYSVFVQARNILFSPQDYALVVTGDFNSTLNEF